jgi:hypothetical protein
LEEIGFTVGAERQVQPEQLYRLLLRLVERVDAACERTIWAPIQTTPEVALRVPGRRIRLVVGDNKGDILPNRNQGSH